MRVFNADKTQELESYDLSLGWLRGDTIVTHHEPTVMHHDEEIIHHEAVIIHHDAVTVHHDAVQGVQEQGHYEVVAEYPNGGKDVRWVVDVPGVEGHDAYDEIVTPAYDEMVSPEYDERHEAYDVVEKGAWDEYEAISLYIPYTEKELMEKEREACMEWLREHDYVGIKIATGRATVEDYADIIAEMTVKADRINELDALIEALGEEDDSN